MRKAAEIITDSKTANVLVDPMRREIVRLLAESEKTENDLANLLGLADPSVGHHLKVLRDKRLVRVVRKQAEKHGILQKFYEANATAYIVDGRQMPQQIERYFMPISLERARGIITAVSMILKKSPAVSSEDMEKFAKIFAAAIVDIARSKFSKPCNTSREELLGKLYHTALTHLLKEPERLPVNVRTILRRVVSIMRP
jgi:DNA-binding transcriptional ArsR family regulator